MDCKKIETYSFMQLVSKSFELGEQKIDLPKSLVKGRVRTRFQSLDRDSFSKPRWRK